MALAAESLRALKTLERALGWPTFNYGPFKNIPCTRGKSSDRKALEAGGFKLVSDIFLLVRLDQIPDGMTLLIKKELSIDGVLWRIDELNSAPDGAYIIVGCNNPHQGA